MKIYAESDIGKVRISNEDCYDFEIISNDLAWAIVCDGMGGANFGEVASKMTREIVRSELRENLKNFNAEILEDEIKNIMLKSIKKANESVYNKAENSKFKGMATTIVLVLFCKDVLHVAHVGDSRAYVLSKSRIKQITEDHSVVAELVKNGKINAMDAKNHPQKNIITRAVGASKSIQIDYSITKVKGDEEVLLCTDGLSNYLESKDIFSYFCNYKGEGFVKKLIDAANALGGKDNITVLLISKDSLN